MPAGLPIASTPPEWATITWSEPSAAFSVIITNHNYSAFVGDAIDSALSQTETDVEVLVVDEGSTDDSRAVIDR